MPKTPKRRKRLADVATAAVTAMKIGAAEIGELGETKNGKSRAAVELGRKGGRARAAKLSAKQRTQIARKAAQARHSR